MQLDTIPKQKLTPNVEGFATKGPTQSHPNEPLLPRLKVFERMGAADEFIPSILYLYSLGSRLILPPVRPREWSHRSSANFGHYVLLAGVHRSKQPLERSGDHRHRSKGAPRLNELWSVIQEPTSIHPPSNGKIRVEFLPIFPTTCTCPAPWTSKVNSLHQTWAPR